MTTTFADFRADEPAAEEVAPRIVGHSIQRGMLAGAGTGTVFGFCVVAALVLASGGPGILILFMSGYGLVLGCLVGTIAGIACGFAVGIGFRAGGRLTAYLVGVAVILVSACAASLLGDGLAWLQVSIRVVVAAVGFALLPGHVRRLETL